jgi:hypothetical protein
MTVLDLMERQLYVKEQALQSALTKRMSSPGKTERNFTRTAMDIKQEASKKKLQPEAKHFSDYLQTDKLWIRCYTTLTSYAMLRLSGQCKH